IGAMLVAATRTSLTGMARVGENHAHTPGFGLVSDEGTQLREAPVVQPTALFPPGLDTVTDAGQVLQNDGAAGRNVLDNAASENMIAVPAEACLPATEDAQAPLGALAPFSLALALLAEEPRLDLFPAALAQELCVTRDRRLVDAQV